MGEEEEKHLMSKVSRLNQGMDPDEGSGLIDEDLDEEDVVHKEVKPMKKQPKKNPRDNRNAPQITVTNLNQPSAVSVMSIDESTVRTSVEMNSSTNKSSGEEKSNNGDS